jgi:hypothetical protein
MQAGIKAASGETRRRRRGGWISGARNPGWPGAWHCRRYDVPLLLLLDASSPFWFSQCVRRGGDDLLDLLAEFVVRWLIDDDFCIAPQDSRVSAGAGRGTAGDVVVHVRYVLKNPSSLVE